VRIAVLDLGTNTFHLLIADVKGKDFSIIYKSKKSVKLGQGGIHQNRISEKSFGRGIVALLKFKEVLDNHRPDKVYAFATSAVRSSENGESFTKIAKEKTGIEIEVISGDREAEFIYYGVRQCIDLDERPSMIIDIGGGSTEFIIADNKNIFWKYSFNIGAARILEQFQPSNPVTLDEISEMQSFFDDQLKLLEAAVKKFSVKRLIGSSGSFDTFAEMIGQRFYHKSIIRGRKSYKFDLGQFYELNKTIIYSTKAERVKMKGLVRMRIDMIVIAGIFVEYILKKFSVEEMYLSKFALKEGALSYIITNN
jgi:exopolyphosphatase/guanosine-5'-triphosphate,3'-diphosphate pyrophosphatase